jgi:hypothetical protein
MSGRPKSDEMVRHLITSPPLGHCVTLSRSSPSNLASSAQELLAPENIKSELTRNRLGSKSGEAWAELDITEAEYDACVEDASVKALIAALEQQGVRVHPTWYTNGKGVARRGPAVTVWLEAPQS